MTGAGQGLGQRLALALARAGSDLVLVGRHREGIDRVAKEIRNMGRRAKAIPADVTNSDQISGMVQTVLSEFEKIDVLVNNAGQNASYVAHPFEDIPEEEWNSMIQTNITGIFLVTKIVGKTMLARGSGKIINIASWAGVRPFPGHLCYSVTKAAVIHLTKVLAAEWSSRGVTINCFAPGSLDLYPDSKDKGYLEEKEQRKKRIVLGRLGGLEEMGPTVVFLASAASDYMTGATVFVDGGILAG